MVAKNTEDIEMMKLDLQLIKHDLKRKVGYDEFCNIRAARGYAGNENEKVNNSNLKQKDGI